MSLRLYNSLTRKKEVFKPIRDKQVGLYCCGPTVYWYAHIGNLRAYIFEDILRRALKYNGYQINHIMNYTDVGHLTSDADSGEDKMEKGAKREGKTAWEIAEFYIKEFEKDAEALNILKPDRTPRATEHIDEQIDLIKILEKKGFTYTIGDGVYFNTSKSPDYAKLAKLDIGGLKAGARVEMAKGKKNPTDFALWKFSPNPPMTGQKRQMEWKSPWGVGFPGWHIECSAMAKKYLGEQFDIHCGGIDHLNIHHTNEIAQSRAAFDKIPAKFWLHGEFLLIDRGRMGKSEKNFLTVKTLLDKGFNPLAYRYLCLTAHYRSKLNFTWESLSAAQNAFNNLKSAVASAPEYNRAPGPAKHSRTIAANYRQKFLAALNNDLNTPEALGIAWKLLKDEAILPADKKIALLDFDKVLGLKLSEVKKIEIPQNILDLAQKRQKLRQEKKWSEADKVRKEIEKLGYKTEDTPEGPKIEIN
jgi:cysteinyl-tRNA synthetase